LRLTVLATAVLFSACATIRGSGARTFADLDRAEIARCRFDEARAIVTTAAVSDLAGEYRLFMTSDLDSSTLESGSLALRPAVGSPGGQSAPAVLTGATEIDAGSLDAMVPGDAGSTDAAAPGVGVYAFDNPDGTPGLVVVVRLGAEANRTDEQRFDGAHTTLRVSSIAPDRFGGTWTSADGTSDASGDFCAVRS